jgi:hypothetical protein
MKALLPGLCLLALFIGLCWGSPREVKLTDGSILKGEVTAPQAGGSDEITVATEYGVIRVPAQKLTPESKAALGIGKAPTPADYEIRIRNLEQRIAALEEENATLRRQLASNTAPPASPRPSALVPSSNAPSAAPASTPASSLSYTLSSTGKRHNSRCRYYGSGKPCGASDGVACKICGG